MSRYYLIGGYSIYFIEKSTLSILLLFQAGIMRLPSATRP